MRTPLPVVLLLALAGSLPAADDSVLWQYVHPQSRLIAGGDLKKAESSVLWKQLKKEFNASQSKMQGADVLNMMERFVVSMPELPGARAAPPVIALEGTFDRARLKKTMPAGTGTERFKGVDLFVPPKSRNTDMLLALVNERVALIGNRSALEQTLAPREDSGNALLKRARDLSVRNALWVVSDEGLLQSAAADNAPPFLKDVTYVDLALALDKGIDLSILLGAKSPEAAKALAAMTESAKYLAGGAGKKAQGTGMELLQRLQVSVGANEVRLNFVMPLAEVTQMVAGMKSGLMDAGMAMVAGIAGGGTPSLGFPAGTRPAVKASPAPAPVIAVAPPAPEAPQKRTIRIVGLEAGDKEVTYTTGTKPPGTN